MSNYIEYNDRVAFHPGYYIKEIIEDSGLTQADFARRLGTTPKNISILVRGEQSLSVDIANKLSRMLGTSLSYWLNLQQQYDEVIAEFMRLQELERERETFKLIDYGYFRKYFGFPDHTRHIDDQIESVRKYLSVASLTVLEQQDLAVDFRNYKESPSRSNIVNSNVMLQIAVNMTLEKEMPRYDKKKFEKCIQYALSLTKNHDDYLSRIETEFKKAGVCLVVLPHIKNSGITGATKKVDGKVMILVNDRRHYEDAFWFTLFHEIGHVINGELGASTLDDTEADDFAQRMLIPEEKYQDFILMGERYDEKSIREFADKIDRDPGIVLGRLLVENRVNYSNTDLCKRLRRRFNVEVPEYQF